MDKTLELIKTTTGWNEKMIDLLTKSDRDVVVYTSTGVEYVIPQGSKIDFDIERDKQTNAPIAKGLYWSKDGKTLGVILTFEDIEGAQLADEDTNTSTGD